MSAGRTEQANAREHDIRERRVAALDGFERYSTDTDPVDVAADTLIVEDVPWLLARVDALTAALTEIHECQCGCDRPGNLSACVAEPVEEFALLAGRADTDGNGKACEPWCRATPGHDGACVRPAR